ncbi:MAG: hypothetical protein ABIO44_12315, partial [Saprospiraceae bacterium]
MIRNFKTSRNVLLFWILGITFLNANSIKGDYRVQVLEGILNKLFDASTYSERHKPGISISKSSTLAASYIPSKNMICIEKKLYRICTKLDKDSIQALAFIISHELSHVFQKLNYNKSEFESFTNIKSNSLENEELEADVQATFICYLAGYNLGNVLDKLMDEIYFGYNLELKGSGIYPSKSLRKKSTEIMLVKADELIQLFEVSHILHIESEFELADFCYKYILKKYRGPEIYNNLGVSLALQAMQLYNKDVDIFSYPFELDINSNLYKVKESRGDLSSENSLLRENLLEQAQDYFRKSLSLNPTYLPAVVNIICCLNLRGNPMEALKQYQSLKFDANYLKRNKSEMAKLNLALGISYALIGNDECRNYFNECMRSEFTNIQNQANANLNKYNNFLVRTSK